MTRILVASWFVLLGAVGAWVAFHAPRPIAEFAVSYQPVEPPLSRMAGIGQ